MFVFHDIIKRLLTLTSFFSRRSICYTNIQNILKIWCMAVSACCISVPWDIRLVCSCSTNAVKLCFKSCALTDKSVVSFSYQSNQMVAYTVCNVKIDVIVDGNIIINSYHSNYVRILTMSVTQFYKAATRVSCKIKKNNCYLTMARRNSFTIHI